MTKKSIDESILNNEPYVYFSKKYKKDDVIEFIKLITERNKNVVLISNTIESINMYITEQLFFASINNESFNSKDIDKKLFNLVQKYKFIHISQNKKIHDIFTMNLRHLKNLIDKKISDAMFSGKIDNILNKDISFMEMVLYVKLNHPEIIVDKEKETQSITDIF